jgi:zinc transport system ATP-binding protein
MPAIDIHNLCFGYENREVLHNINLAIGEGDFAIVVGPNGGGKTTLLKLMLGLLMPNYGKVTVFGTPPAQARRQIGYVPQSLAYDPRFPISVLELALLGRVDRHRFGGFDRLDREAALEALREVGLADCADRPFAALSGGQRQRALIAQALATAPRLLLLDEPCANLDADGSDTIHNLLKALNRRLTIVMVSHNLGLVEASASHVICVNHTADIHPVAEVAKAPQKTGYWLHLLHDSCPVAHGSDEDLCDTPHLGAAEAPNRH